MPAHAPASSAGRTVLEALQDFPSAAVPLQWLLQIVPCLQPRYFSIASSLAAHPGQVHILAALVDYQTPHRRRKRGVCSAWLAGLQPGMPDAVVSGSRSAKCSSLALSEARATFRKPCRTDLAQHRY